MNKTQNILMEIVRDNADESNTLYRVLTNTQINAIQKAVSWANTLEGIKSTLLAKVTPSRIVNKLKQLMGIDVF